MALRDDWIEAFEVNWTMETIEDNMNWQKANFGNIETWLNGGSPTDPPPTTTAQSTTSSTSTTTSRSTTQASSSTPTSETVEQPTSTESTTLAGSTLIGSLSVFLMCSVVKLLF